VNAKITPDIQINSIHQCRALLKKAHLEISMLENDNNNYKHFCNECSAMNFITRLYLLVESRDSSVGITTGYGLDDQGEWEFEYR
jgi:hypothetical protein